MQQVLIPLAEGLEEMETIIVVDIFRRVPWSVTMAAIAPGPVKASRGTRLLPDALWAEIDPAKFDILVIPGGAAGTQALSADERVLAAARLFKRTGKWLAAICAGPLVLQAAGVLDGCQVTCHPGVAQQLTQAHCQQDRVVLDGRLITSQGPGSSFEFALAIIAAVSGPARADALAQDLLIRT